MAPAPLSFWVAFWVAFVSVQGRSSAVVYAQSVRPAPEALLPPTHVVTPGVAGASVALSTRRGFGMAWVVWGIKRDPGDRLVCLALVESRHTLRSGTVELRLTGGRGVTLRVV